MYANSDGEPQAPYRISNRTVAVIRQGSITPENAMTIKSKPRAEPNFVEQPIKASSWRNLSFVADGTTALGEIIHPSEESALSSEEQWKRRVFERGYFIHQGKVMTSDQYLFAVQIPAQT